MLKFAPLISIYDFDESKEIQTEVIWAFSINLKGISSVRHRLNIYIVQNPKQEQQNVQGSILSVWKYASVGTYSKLSKPEQKHFLLKLIYECLLEIAALSNWNNERITSAFINTVSGGIRFSYTSQATWNKQKNAKAVTELVLCENKISIWIIFSVQKIKNPVKIHLLDTSPIQFSFFRFFGDPFWIDDKNYGFRFSNGVTLSASPDSEYAVWSTDQSLEHEFFRKRLDLNEKMTPKEWISIINS